VILVAHSALLVPQRRSVKSRALRWITRGRPILPRSIAPASLVIL
jgi:hypothetical protein